MWKRDQVAKPTPGQPAVPVVPSPPVATPPISQAAPAPVPVPVAASEPPQNAAKSELRAVHIGKSVVIKGDLLGSEDLTIEGQVEGTIELNENVLTIGANARIKAQVFAKTVVILGNVQGNVTASEKVDLRDGASVTGDLTSPRVAIAEGAQFRGSVDMQRGAKRAQPSTAAASGAKPPSGAPPVQRDQVPVAAAAAH